MKHPETTPPPIPTNFAKPTLVVERTLSWLQRNRRLMAYYESLAIIAEGFAKLAIISMMLRRLTEPNHQAAT